MPKLEDSNAENKRLTEADTFIFKHRIDTVCKNAPSVAFGSDFKLYTYDDGRTEIVPRFGRCCC